MSYQLIIGKEVLNMPIRNGIELADREKDGLLRELSKVAEEIHQLRRIVDQIDHMSSDFDRTCIRLDAAEQDYFLLFNQYRMVCSFKPLEGKKFTGSNHRYESVLF